MLSVLSTCFVSPVAGATSQGLEWGVKVDDQFDFDGNIEGSLGYWDGEVHMNVTGIDAIPDIVTSWAQIPEVNVSLAWDNGTAMDRSIFMSGLIYFGGRFCVPSGNFSLLEDLVKGSPFWNSTIVFEGRIGYWSANFTLSNTSVIISTYVSYLLSDGFLAQYSVMTSSRTYSDFTWVGFVRLGLLSDNIVIGSPLDIVFFAVCILVLFEIAARTKKHKRARAPSPEALLGA